MIRNSRQLIKNKQIKGKSGGFANESRFGGWEHELREHKVITLPSMDSDNAVILEQGWNKLAKNMDIVRMRFIAETGEEFDIVVEREDIEQAFAFMAQGDEILKYCPSTIK